MNSENYSVEITITPEDAKFTERCEAAGLPLVVISMYKSALKKLVADEREACAKVCNLIAKEIDDTNGTATYCAKAIRARSEK